MPLHHFLIIKIRQLAPCRKLCEKTMQSCPIRQGRNGRKMEALHAFTESNNYFLRRHDDVIKKSAAQFAEDRAQLHETRSPLQEAITSLEGEEGRCKAVRPFPLPPIQSTR